MRNWILCLISIVLSSSSIYASETAKGVKKDYEAFKQEMSLKLDAAEAKLTEVKAKAAQKGGEAQAKTVVELEKTRDRLRQELNGFQEDSKAGWQAFKRSLSKSVNRFNNKVQDALKE